MSLDSVCEIRYANGHQGRLRVRHADLMLRSNREPGQDTHPMDPISNTRWPTEIP